MKEELKAILNNLSYSDIQEALETKKKHQIDALKKKKQSIKKELRKIKAQFDLKISAIDTELETITGKAVKTAKTATNTFQSKELTETILKIFGSAPGRHFDASKIISMLKDSGFTGDIEIAKKKIAIYLSRLLQKGHIKRVSRGIYTVDPDKTEQ